MLHGIVPVHVDATPTIGPSSRAGSIPIARKCARAGARAAPLASSSRALRRASGRGIDCGRGEPLVVGAREPADADRADARVALEDGDAPEEEREERIEARTLDGIVAHLL